MYLERSPELVIALVAIVKPGGAYLPIDPSYPAERVQYLVRDAGAAWIVTRPELEPGLAGSGASLFCLDSDGAARRPAAPARGIHPAHLAYRIYTSGSTGRPKGVEVTHGGLDNYLAWAASAYDVEPLERSSVHSSMSFDLTGRHWNSSRGEQTASRRGALAPNSGNDDPAGPASTRSVMWGALVAAV